MPQLGGIARNPVISGYQGKTAQTGIQQLGARELRAASVSVATWIIGHRQGLLCSAGPTQDVVS